jgi:hypothetical protein
MLLKELYNITEAAKPNGSGYDAWFKKIKAKYPDATARTTGENGWSRLGFKDDKPTLTPRDDGPHYTDVSSEKYSRQRLVGTFNHSTNTGKYFVKDLDEPSDKSFGVGRGRKLMPADSKF